MNGEVWDSPTDLIDGERIELSDSYGTIEGTVVDVIDGIVSVSIDAFKTTVFSVDPEFTRWRRATPKVMYCVYCSEKYCREWFPHAEYSPTFKCRNCRNR